MIEFKVKRGDYDCQMIVHDQTEDFGEVAITFEINDDETNPWWNSITLNKEQIEQLVNFINKGLSDD